MKFLCRCLTTATVPPSAPQIKPLSEALAGLLEDSFEGARNEAATCLGTLMKIVGERPLNAIMDQLAEVRKVKVKEAYEKASVKCKAGSGPAPRSAPPAKAKAPAAKPPQATAASSMDAFLDDVSPPKPKAKPPARLLAKKAQAGDAADPESPAVSVEQPKPAAKPPARLMVSSACMHEQSKETLTNRLASEETSPCSCRSGSSSVLETCKTLSTGCIRCTRYL